MAATVLMERAGSGTMNVAPAKVQAYLDQGWTLAEGQVMPDPSPAPAPEPEPETMEETPAPKKTTRRTTRSKAKK